MRHAPFQGAIASHFAFVQALAATAAHRPTEYKLRKCHCTRLMFSSSIGGPGSDLPGSEIQNAPYIARRFADCGALAYDAGRSFTRFSAQGFFALVG